MFSVFLVGDAGGVFDWFRMEDWLVSKLFFCCKENHGCFGGGFNFQRFVMFSPRIFAKMIQFDVHNFFLDGWRKTTN